MRNKKFQLENAIKSLFIYDTYRILLSLSSSLLLLLFYSFLINSQTPITFPFEIEGLICVNIYLQTRSYLMTEQPRCIFGSSTEEFFFLFYKKKKCNNIIFYRKQNYYCSQEEIKSCHLSLIFSTKTGQPYISPPPLTLFHILVFFIFSLYFYVIYMKLSSPFLPKYKSICIGFVVLLLLSQL